MPNGIPFLFEITWYFCIFVKIIDMETIHLDLNKRYTFADYLTWMDNIRRELIDGFVKMMTPAPLRIHQEVSSRLFLSIGNQLAGKSCKVYYAPFDVRLPNNSEQIADEQVYTVVQPDISVICDLKKLDEKGCIGAPDFIIEIISPYTAKVDVEDKYHLYQKHSVKEYWIVYPESKSVSIFLLNNDQKYQLIGMFAGDSNVKVNIFEDVTVNLKEIFRD